VKRGRTPSDDAATAAGRLRRARARVDADPGLRGDAYGRALADAVDEACRDVAAALDGIGRFSVVALGSYARRELCPGSDLDVMLLHDGSASRPAIAAAAEELWYPFWDAGFVLGHAVRTPKEALALGASELDTLTGLVDLRCVAGDRERADHTRERARRLARRHEARIVKRLAADAAARTERPGSIAEVLEPNLKEGAGGLRDLDALGWAGIAAGDASARSGIEQLAAAGLVEPRDPAELAAARRRLLDARVALHRVTAARSDVLLLQEQDAVAAMLGTGGADELLTELALAARGVTWIAGDVWRRLLDDVRGPLRRLGRREREVAPGVVLRDGAVSARDLLALDTLTALQVATAAAACGRPIERSSLERMRGLRVVAWTPKLREAFVGLLRAGRSAVPVMEALDQVGVLEALLPEWAHVRARPQRNAYHRFTVDRHLLECVAECAAVLDDPGFDGDVARRTRQELLLFGALLHDIGKGLPGDHSEGGAAVAQRIGTRVGLDDHAVDVLVWLVRQHLLLADTATRRDLSDEATIVRFGRAVRDTERLDLLYALTVGDSRATGPSAWSRSKAALLRQLFFETDTLLERGVVGRDHDAERAAILDRHRDLLESGDLALSWSTADDGLVECAVAAPDRPGLLATVAGALALHGFDVREARVYGAPADMALEVYRGVDRFGRLDDAGRAAVESDLAAALAGTLALRDRLADRFQRYRPEPGPSSVRVAFDLGASTAATVVEIEAADEVGLLARVAAVFTDLGFDVTAALVSTLGDRVVDVFYLRDEHGAKPTRPLVLDRLRATLVARLTAESLPQ
jgi:[protein-PII] uridylyltransferase